MKNSSRSKIFTIKYLSILFFIVLFIAGSKNLCAQEKDTSKIVCITTPVIYPEYPGGIKGLYDFLTENIQYPKIALDNCVKGIVYLKFIIEADGSVSDAVVMRGIGSGCDEEALRVINLMEGWIPGKLNGKPVAVSYKLPVKFEPGDCKIKSPGIMYDK